MTGPLAGVRVLELGRLIAAPHCAMILGDLGADVVKVETAGRGDDSRRAPTPAYFLQFNRNKRGVALDFHDRAELQVLHRLIGRADVLIENSRPGWLETIGCGWERLRLDHPRLIVARVSGFGQTGPLASLPCTDAIAQAMGGLMELTGDPDGPPKLCGSYVVDYQTALYAAVGILAALRQRDRTGRGQLLDVAMLDVAASMLVTAIPDHSMTGAVTTRSGGRDRLTAPSGTFRAGDGGWVQLVVLPHHRDRLASVVGDADWDDMEESDRVFAEWVAALPADEAARALQRAGVLAAKVASVWDVVRNEQLRSRGQLVTIPHPEAGRYETHGVTLRLEDMPDGIRRPPPTLGQHTMEVLAEWLH